MPSHIITVLGPVKAESLGITDAHNHLWINPVLGADPGAPVLQYEDLILAELKDFQEAGGVTQVDCQPPGCGRDANRLRRLSERSGVKVVACTGFHRRRYYPAPAPLFDLDAKTAADFFLDEIDNGLLETRGTRVAPVYPGFIKIAAEASFADSPIALFEAAAEACLKRGVCIEMHTEKGAAVEHFLEFFTARAVPAERLIFCHMDKRPDLGLHMELSQAGVGLEYDTFFRPKYEPENNVWPLLQHMLVKGWMESLILATDLAEAVLWRRMGDGPGLIAFITQVQDRLQSLGIPNEQITLLMGGNIARKLAVDHKE